MPSFFYLCEIDNLNALFLSIFKSCQSTTFSVGFYISHKKVCVVYHPLIPFCYCCFWVSFAIYGIPNLIVKFLVVGIIFHWVRLKKNKAAVVVSECFLRSLCG